MSTPSRLRRSIAGVGWTSGTAFVARVLSWAVTLVLAGKLGAGGYGLVSLAWIVYSAAILIRDQTITTTVVYRGESTGRWSRLFWWSLASSFGLAGMALLAVPALRTWTGQPGAFFLVLFLGLALIVSSLGTVPTGILQSRLRFRTLAIAEMASVAVYCLVALLLLSWGHGVVSIGLAQLAGAGVGAASTIALSGFRPSVRRAADTSAGSWERYGAAALVLSAGLFVFTNIDTLAVAKGLGGSILGRYSLAFNLAYVCAAMASIVSVKVMMPLMSDLRASGESLRASFLIGQRFALGFAIAVTATLVLLAPAWLVPVFGPSYGGTEILLRLLAAYGFFSIMANPSMTVLRATGMVWAGAAIIGMQVIAVVVMLGPMIQKFGAPGAAVAATASLLGGTLAMTMLVSRRLDVGYGAMWRSARPSLLASLWLVPAAILSLFSDNRWLELPIWIACLMLFGVALARPVVRRLRAAPEVSPSPHDSVSLR